MTFLAWAEADSVRYLWYALSLAGTPPHLLTWLRRVPAWPQNAMPMCQHCQHKS